MAGSFRPLPPAWELDWSSVVGSRDLIAGQADEGMSDNTVVSALLDAWRGTNVLSSFDWSEWSKSVGATEWFDDPGMLAVVGLEDVRRMLVALVRANRFSDGTLAAALRTGVIDAALDRAGWLWGARAAAAGTLEVLEADLTRLDVDAIVNAANPRMLGGGGVDGAVHRAAGPGLLAACREVEEVAPDVRCPVGDARVTPGFDLPARWVVHTVGPRWSGGDDGESMLLSRAYGRSLDRAADVGARTVAFPAISTGVFGYPADLAACDAVAACLDWLADHPEAFDRVILVAHGAEAVEVLRAAVSRVSR